MERQSPEKTILFALVIGVIVSAAVFFDRPCRSGCFQMADAALLVAPRCGWVRCSRKRLSIRHSGRRSLLQCSSVRRSALVATQNE